MKTYVLMVAKKLPAHCSNAGEPTRFKVAMDFCDKKHTIRANYDFWKKRIDEVNAGMAMLSVRQWEDKPYRSHQVEFKRCGLGMGSVDIQKLNWEMLGWFIDECDSDVTTETIAKNDGLTTSQFFEWFKGYPKEAMAIIHFTNFRY